MLEWLFCPQCPGCGSPSATLCEPCAATLVELGPSCPRCAEPADDAGLCRRCRREPLPLDSIVSPWKFGGQLALAIRKLKLSQRGHVARDLAPLWAPLVGAVAVAHDALVVPVAMYWRRRMMRGLDHAWLLAVHACADAGLPPPSAVLRRVKGSPPQRGLTADERRDNLVDAFEVRDPRVVKGRAIALVDDVVTTGATLAAAAIALRDAGATMVVGVALARATSSPG